MIYGRGNTYCSVKALLEVKSMSVCDGFKGKYHEENDENIFSAFMGDVVHTMLFWIF